jgi:hypothetical protein
MYNGVGVEVAFNKFFNEMGSAIVGVDAKATPTKVEIAACNGVGFREWV